MILAEYSLGSASRSAADLCLGDLSGADVERFGEVFEKLCARGMREARMDLARTLTGWTPRVRPKPWRGGLAGWSPRASDTQELALQGVNLLARIEATSQAVLADLGGDLGAAFFLQVPVTDPVIGQPCSTDTPCPPGYRCFTVESLPAHIRNFVSAADLTPRCVKDTSVSDDPLDGFHRLMREYEPYMPSWLYNFINGAVETIFGFIKDFLGVISTIKRKVQELKDKGAEFVRDGIKSLNPGTETGRRNILKMFLTFFTVGLISPVGIIPSSAVDSALDEYHSAKSRNASTVEMVAGVLGKVFQAVTNGPAFKLIGIGIAAVNGDVVGAVSKASTMILGAVSQKIAQYSSIASQITGILKALLESTDNLKAILSKGAAALEEESTYFLLGGMIQAAGGSVGAFGFVIADNAPLLSSALKNGFTHDKTQGIFRAKFLAPVEAAIFKAKADAQAAVSDARETGAKIKRRVQESGAAALDPQYGDAMAGVSGILSALGKILDSIGATLRDGKLIPFQLIRDAGAAISEAGRKLQIAAAKVLQFGRSIQKLTSKLADPERAVQEALSEAQKALPDPKVVAEGAVAVAQEELAKRGSSTRSAGEEAAPPATNLLADFRAAIAAYDAECRQYGGCGAAVASNPAVQTDRDNILRSLAAGEAWGERTANAYIPGIRKFLADRSEKRRFGKQPSASDRRRAPPSSAPQPATEEESSSFGSAVFTFGAVAFAGALVLKARKR